MEAARGNDLSSCASLTRLMVAANAVAADSIVIVDRDRFLPSPSPNSLGYRSCHDRDLLRSFFFFFFVFASLVPAK